MAKILVIDDDGAIRRLISRILVPAGHEVIEASGGKLGLEMSGAEQPSIIIVDILMPDTDGIETIRSLVAARSSVGIIAISGGGLGSSKFYLDMATKLGAHRFLEKPFTRMDLLTAINSLLP